MKSQEKKKSISPSEDSVSSKKKEKIANTAWVLGRSYSLGMYINASSILAYDYRRDGKG
jgi:hypothetical protein